MTTTTVSEGVDEMGGGFALLFEGEKTETLLYTAAATSVEAVLEVEINLRSNTNCLRFLYGEHGTMSGYCLNY